MNPNTTTATPPEGVVTTAPDSTHIALGRELKALFIRHGVKEARVKIYGEDSDTVYNWLKDGFRADPQGGVRAVAGDSLVCTRSHTSKTTL